MQARNICKEMATNLSISGCSDYSLGQNVQGKNCCNSWLFLTKNEGHDLLASLFIRRKTINTWPYQVVSKHI